MDKLIIPSGQGKNYQWAKDHIFIKTPYEFTAGGITLVEDTLKAGFHLPRHYHKVMTEVFYILSGAVRFQFDDETVLATAGMTINVPPNTWHDVTCAEGAKLLTIFVPGGFDHYLQELSGLSDAQFADSAFMDALGEKYDTWMR